jgi:hypothetical protein
MSKIKNILFSSTRQWNPGDEFIQFGCEYLISQFFNFNSLLFNRNPQIRSSFDFLNPLLSSSRAINYTSSPLSVLLSSFFRLNFWDNSFKNRGEYKVDYCIISGSPEWYGRRMVPLFDFIKKYQVPTLFLGLGGNRKQNYSDFSVLDWCILKNAKLITTRDDQSQRLLSELKSKRMPCPALFSCENTKKIDSIKKIGLVYSTNNSTENNRVDYKTALYLNHLYSKLIEKYSCEFICHYIDELEPFYKDFPDSRGHYHYDARQYESIYSQFDLVISPRIHGCGIASSLCIPNIHISHSDRSLTVEGFNSIIKPVNTKYDDMCSLIDILTMSIKERNTEMFLHKKNTLNEYHKLLSSTFLSL